MYKKIGEMSDCLNKIDKTIHGDEEIGFYNGLATNQQKTTKELKEIKELMWFPKLVDDFWRNVKKPLYIVIFFTLLLVNAYFPI